MSANKTIVFVRKRYNNVLLIFCAGLIAFVFYFAVAIAPKLPEARAQGERLRNQEIAAEHNLICQKWGMPLGTPANPQCVLDLQAFREKVEKRLDDENIF